MVQKRPFGDEESYEVSSKHPRQLEYSNQLVSFLEFVSTEDTAQQPNISGVGSFVGGDEKQAGGIITEHPICTQKDSETSAPGCFSNTSWASSSMSEEDDGSETPFHFLTSSPDHYNADRPIRTLLHSEEICSFLECRPRKLVPIGPDFQADVPGWGAQGAKNSSDGSDGSELLSLFPQASESDLSDHDDIENKLAGFCVIPIPEFGPSAYNGDKVGDGRTDCHCKDFGSVRCVRQHIKEERENLWRTLGREKFLELGFADMGEVVADKWSQEEELLFRKVVFSSPAKLGKNFWDHLSMVFPSRARKDIVSYYFNVFMLQKRAVQNRCSPMDIDSDDDDWQGGYDSGDEVGTAEEDEDSVVESPVCRDDPGDNEIAENDAHVYDDRVPCAGFNSCENIFLGCDNNIINVPETCSRKLLNHYGPDPTHQLPGKLVGDEKEDHGSSQDEKGDNDVQDDSCTSDDPGTAAQVTQMKDENSKCHLGSFNSMSGGDSHEFVLEHCDTKVWDVGYLTYPKNKVEFLPTCSMIEEVFGVGSWNYTARDSKGLN